MEAVKDGLNEKSEIKDSEGSLGMKRENPGQVPKAKPVKKVTKGGKKFKIS